MASTHTFILTVLATIALAQGTTACVTDVAHDIVLTDDEPQITVSGAMPSDSNIYNGQPTVLINVHVPAGITEVRMKSSEDTEVVALFDTDSCLTTAGVEHESATTAVVAIPEDTSTVTVLVTSQSPEFHMSAHQVGCSRVALVDADTNITLISGHTALTLRSTSEGATAGLAPPFEGSKVTIDDLSPSCAVDGGGTAMLDVNHLVDDCGCRSEGASVSCLMVVTADACTADQVHRTNVYIDMSERQVVFGMNAPPVAPPLEGLELEHQVPGVRVLLCPAPAATCVEGDPVDGFPFNGDWELLGDASSEETCELGEAAVPGHESLVCEGGPSRPVGYIVDHNHALGPEPQQFVTVETAAIEDGAPETNVLHFEDTVRGGAGASQVLQYYLEGQYIVGSGGVAISYAVRVDLATLSGTGCCNNESPMQVGIETFNHGSCRVMANYNGNASTPADRTYVQVTQGQWELIDYTNCATLPPGAAIKNTFVKNPGRESDSYVDNVNIRGVVRGSTPTDDCPMHEALVDEAPACIADGDEPVEVQPGPMELTITNEGFPKPKKADGVTCKVHPVNSGAEEPVAAHIKASDNAGAADDGVTAVVTLTACPDSQNICELQCTFTGLEWRFIGGEESDVRRALGDGGAEAPPATQTVKSHRFSIVDGTAPRPDAVSFIGIAVAVVVGVAVMAAAVLALTRVRMREQVDIDV